MKIKKLYIGLSVLAFTAGLSSCGDFLDEMPDNRTTVDTEQKAINLLVSAYANNDYALINEYMSDNVDDNGDNNPNTDRFLDQVYHWQDVTETDNEDPESFWQGSYNAIANANQALQAINEMGATTTALRQARAEALLCRAYNMFMLTNEFCMNYNSKTSDKDLGVPYPEAPESTVSPKYERGTVAEDYQKIEADLQAALADVGDDNYTVPKYHFNTKAAYAFACRFYLYYEKWDKAIEYANRCLGSDPASQLRDCAYTATTTRSFDAWTQHYIDASVNANLLLTTAYSNLGLYFGPYTLGKRYSHCRYLSSHEDITATNIWGTYSANNTYYTRPGTFSGTNLDCVIFYRCPYLFEYTDPVAGIGYRHSVIPLFTTDECLLNRAEAYIMLKQYENAATDLNLWMHNFTKYTGTITPQSITTFYKSVSYSYDDDNKIESTIKKHLHPAFSIDEEGSTQECMLQCVLGFRRIETAQVGLRWFDIKRYGIEIPRRVMGADGNPEEVTDWLTTNDPRRAVQIPLKVRQAGLEANPR